LIISGRYVVLPDGLLKDGTVLVIDGTIEEVGKSDEIVRKNPSEERISFPRSVIMPGLICSHSHAYGAFARGMPLKAEPPKTFGEILERIWWRLDKKLREEDIKYSGLVTAIDAIKHGTTSTMDHHASPYSIRGSLDVLSSAFKEVGLRSNLAYEVSDRDGLDKAEEGIKENVDFIKKHKNDDMITGSFGLHASLTLSDETLQKAVEASKELDVGFHIHVAEGVEDVSDSIRKSGKRVVERLWSHGILGKKTIAVHAVHVSPLEVKILRETGTWVVHCPESNMNNAVGVSPIPFMMDMGVKVALGTDGMTMDMFRESKFMYLLHKLNAADPRVMPPSRIVDTVIRANSELISIYAKRRVGMIQKGACADIIAVRYMPHTPMNWDNFPAHFVFGMDSSQVEMVMVNGRIVFERGSLLTVNEEEIMIRAEKLAMDLWERIN